MHKIQFKSILSSTNIPYFHFPSGPCAPTNISASLLCENNTAKVSWQPCPGAASYNVTAAGGNGDVKQCATNISSCLIPNMSCGQTYSITVSPFSNQCKGQDSQTYIYYSGKKQISKK